MQLPPTKHITNLCQRCSAVVCLEGVGAYAMGKDVLTTTHVERQVTTNNRCGGSVDAGAG